MAPHPPMRVGREKSRTSSVASPVLMISYTVCTFWNLTSKSVHALQLLKRYSVIHSLTSMSYFILKTTIFYLHHYIFFVLNIMLKNIWSHYKKKQVFRVSPSIITVQFVRRAIWALCHAWSYSSSITTVRSKCHAIWALHRPWSYT